MQIAGWPGVQRHSQQDEGIHGAKVSWGPLGCGCEVQVLSPVSSGASPTKVGDAGHAAECYFRIET